MGAFSLPMSQNMDFVYDDKKGVISFRLYDGRGNLVLTPSETRLVVALITANSEMFLREILQDVINDSNPK